MRDHAWDGGRLTVELYVRSLAPRVGHERLDTVVDRLDHLASTGYLADFTVRITGDEIPATPADAVSETGAFLSRRVSSFESWASRTGRSLDASFERRIVASGIIGQTHTAIVPPMIAMAEFLDGDVRYVSPCSDSHGQVSVEDRLTSMESAATGQESDVASRRLSEPRTTGR
ncbi:MAG: HTH domain-containing protein [Salinirussus sp.]